MWHFVGRVIVGAALLGILPITRAQEPVDPPKPRIASVVGPRDVKASNRLAEVLTRDEFSITFAPVPAKMSEVRIGLVTPSITAGSPPPSAAGVPPPVVPPPAVTELARTAAGSDTEVRVILPRGQEPGIYKLVYTTGPSSTDPAKWTDDGAFVAIWPLPNATISDISPKTIRPGTVVKVSGTGLAAPPGQINFSVGGVPARVTRVDPQGQWLVAIVEESAPKVGTEFFAKAIKPLKGVQVTLWGIPAPLPDDLHLRIERPVNKIWTALLFIFAGVVVAAIYWLVRVIYRTSPNARSWIAVALVEPKNNTYSLARAQFIWWLTIITWGYMFLFLGRGWIEGIWGFPPLSGFAYTFLISLTTLVAGEVTGAIRGVKGAGLTSPSPSDLIMHGGVLALERVQQVMWTVVVGLMFLFITVKTYAGSTSLPTIPPELLTLMGFSSLGYLAGKTARKPGPVISSVSLENNSLTIIGDHISASGVRVQIDGATVEGEITVRRTPPGDTGEFVQGLVVPLTLAQKNEWAQKTHMVTVTNVDEQFAEWKSPPRLSKVRTISDSTESGKKDIVIEGWNIQPGAKLTIDDGKTAVQDVKDPAVWTLTVEAAWLAKGHELQLTNPDGTSSKATWKAASAAGALLAQP